MSADGEKAGEEPIPSAELEMVKLHGASGMATADATEIAAAEGAVVDPLEPEDEAAAAERRPEYEEEHRRTVDRAGATVSLPPDVRRPGDEKPGRRHAIVAAPSAVRFATAIYGTTKRDGPLGIDVPGVSIAMRGSKVTRDWNGLAEHTTFYPALMETFPQKDIPQRHGTLNVDEQLKLQRGLVHTLGLKQGVGGDGTAHPASRRGEVVEVDPVIEKRHNIRYGLVVTHHEISARREVQLVVPLLLSLVDENNPVEDVVTTGPWVELVADPGEQGVWAVPYILTVHEYEEPLDSTTYWVDDEELKRVEAALITRFDLQIALTQVLL